tara:strand:- start:1965 stop:3296 length:1332 start_codon:yes stop_codon:yes gene_type:complete
MKNNYYNDKFTYLFEKHNIDTNNIKFLLAVSGGLDSICLFDFFLKNKLSFSVCHCNFNLREDSKKDLKLVKKLSERNNISFFSKNFDIKKYAKKNKLSLQAAARKERYKWFDNILEKNNIDLLCTAHHINDNLETVIYNLVNSTGFRGIRGIKVLRKNIFRPLMNFNKNELMDYALKNNLEWREDSSNKLMKYSRNRIRLKIIPQLKKINNSLERSVGDTSSNLSELEKFISFQISKLTEKYVDNSSNGFKININKWEKKDFNFFLLKEYLNQLGFNYSQCDNIILSFNRISGKYYESKKFKLIIERGFIFLLEKQKNFKINLNINESGTYKLYDRNIKFEVTNSSSFVLNENKNVAQLDLNKIKFPLKIRNWKKGDSFKPLGMKKNKKVSDFLIDKKVPNYIKIFQCVILSDNNIVWLIDHQIHDEYKVTNKTKKVFNISVN